MRDDAPEHPAQDVAAALVRGLHAVGDQEARGAAVLGDDLQRDVVSVVGAVTLAGERLGDLEQRSEEVGLEDVVDALQEGRHPFEAGAGVDVLGGELADDLQVLSTWSWMNTRFQISMKRSSSTSGPPSGPYRAPRSTKISEHGPPGPAACVCQ